MEFWDAIINTAMIGTDKKIIGTNELPTEILEAATLVTENDKIDKEEKFLQLAALAFNFRQCGVVAMQKRVAESGAGARLRLWITRMTECWTACAKKISNRWSGKKSRSHRATRRPSWKSPKRAL